MVGACESAYGCAYYNTISWRNENTPLPMENRPRAHLRASLRRRRHRSESAFGHQTGRPQHPRRRSTPRSSGCASRSVERIAARSTSIWRRSAMSSGACNWRRDRANKSVPIGSPVGVPEVFSEYFKLMADLMVLAWQTDMTRVITFQMGHEMSGRAYPELGFGDAHHPCTHHQGDQGEAGEDDEDQRPAHEDAVLLPRPAARHLGRRRLAARSLDDPLRRWPERRQSAPLYRSVAPARRRRCCRDQGRTACPLSQPHADGQSASHHAGQGKCSAVEQAGRQLRTVGLPRPSTGVDS